MTIGVEDIVRALRRANGYQPPGDDAPALAARIGDDPDALMAVAEEIRLEAAHMRPVVPDHSQCGEFRLILKALVRAAAKPGIVVDVGARGRRNSNSYDLIASFGWRGILIEALPERAERLREEFGEGDYEVVDCAVGIATGRRPLWLGSGKLISSLVESVAALFGGAGESIEVEVRALADILADQRVPYDFDVLSIDIEGLDVPVFNQLIEASPYRPRLVVVEAPHAFRHGLVELGFSPAVVAGYREIGHTLPNLILERV